MDFYNPPLDIVPLDLNPNDRRRRSMGVVSTNITDQYQRSTTNEARHTSHSPWNGTHHNSNSSSGATPSKGRPSHRRRQDGPVNAALVKSRIPTQSATYLCEHPTSHGPDFVSHAEGKFCDMDTREVWPICATEDESDCFDTESNALKQLETRDLSGQAARKNYVNFRDWE